MNVIMDIKEVYDIWDRFEKSDIDEIEVELGEDRVHFKKTADVDEALGKLAGCMNIRSEAAPVSAPTSAVSTNENASDGSCILPYNGSPVKAPIVGTFYRAPSPGATPFVEEGTKVKKGDVIGIIEAMKLMNELSAPKDGTIETILAEDGKMVEYDQVIMSIN